MCVAQALQHAGFVISPKSQMTPNTEITFVGKWLDSVTMSISSQADMLIQAAFLSIGAVGGG